MWGKCALINLSGCNPDKIRSADNILLWGQAIVNAIGMKAFDYPFIERFALDNEEAIGYSYFQAIETSNITAHFSELHNTAFINIFSCKDFSWIDAVDVCDVYFEFDTYHEKIIEMMPKGEMNVSR